MRKLLVLPGSVAPRESFDRPVIQAIAYSVPVVIKTDWWNRGYSC